MLSEIWSATLSVTFETDSEGKDEVVQGHV